ncbi:MAG: hypothetical protein HC828_02085 [Blastochloris sp.]|nr:hypothetical protein [Blastochloris sp.]
MFVPLKVCPSPARRTQFASSAGAFGDQAAIVASLRIWICTHQPLAN